MFDLTLPQTENIYTQNTMSSMWYRMVKEDNKLDVKRGSAIVAKPSDTAILLFHQKARPSPNRDEKGRFKKGLRPWNKGTKGLVKAWNKIDFATKEELERLYWEEGLSSIEIGERFGIDKSVVLKRMKEYGIPRRNLSEAKKGKSYPRSNFPNKEELKRLYVDEKLSCAEIGEIYNVHWSTVRKWLIKHEIPIRDFSEASTKIDIKKEDLEQLYIKGQWSEMEIAEMYGCSQWVISHRLDKFDIRKRGREESLRLRLDRKIKNISPHELYYLYYQRKLSMREIGDMYDMSITQIRKRMCHYNIPRMKVGFGNFQAPSNKMERQLDKLIQANFPSQYRFVGDRKEGVIIGDKIPDWIYIGRKRRVIELFGEPYHSNLVAPSIKVPHKKTYNGTLEHYKKHKCKCLIIWSEELKYPNKVIQKILNFTK